MPKPLPGENPTYDRFRYDTSDPLTSATLTMERLNRLRRAVEAPGMDALQRDRMKVELDVLRQGLEQGELDMEGQRKRQEALDRLGGMLGGINPEGRTSGGDPTFQPTATYNEGLLSRGGFPPEARSDVAPIYAPGGATPNFSDPEDPAFSILNPLIFAMQDPGFASVYMSLGTEDRAAFMSMVNMANTVSLMQARQRDLADRRQAAEDAATQAYVEQQQIVNLQFERDLSHYMEATFGSVGGTVGQYFGEAGSDDPSPFVTGVANAYAKAYIQDWNPDTPDLVQAGYVNAVPDESVQDESFRTFDNNSHQFAEKDGRVLHASEDATGATIWELGLDEDSGLYYRTAGGAREYGTIADVGGDEPRVITGNTDPQNVQWVPEDASVATSFLDRAFEERDGHLSLLGSVGMGGYSFLDADSFAEARHLRWLSAGLPGGDSPDSPGNRRARTELGISVEENERQRALDIATLTRNGIADQAAQQAMIIALEKWQMEKWQMLNGPGPMDEFVRDAVLGCIAANSPVVSALSGAGSKQIEEATARCMRTMSNSFNRSVFAGRRVHAGANGAVAGIDSAFYSGGLTGYHHLETSAYDAVTSRALSQVGGKTFHVRWWDGNQVDDNGEPVLSSSEINLRQLLAGDGNFPGMYGMFSQIANSPVALESLGGKTGQLARGMNPHQYQDHTMDSLFYSPVMESGLAAPRIQISADGQAWRNLYSPPGDVTGPFFVNDGFGDYLPGQDHLWESLLRDIGENPEGADLAQYMDPSGWLRYMTIKWFEDELARREPVADWIVGG